MVDWDSESDEMEGPKRKTAKPPADSRRGISFIFCPFRPPLASLRLVASLRLLPNSPPEKPRRIGLAPPPKRVYCVRPRTAMAAAASSSPPLSTNPR